MHVCIFKYTQYTHIYFLWTKTFILDAINNLTALIYINVFDWCFDYDFLHLKKKIFRLELNFSIFKECQGCWNFAQIVFISPVDVDT